METTRSETRKMTVYLPCDLATQLDLLTRQGRARTKNELVVVALRHMIDRLNRETIDAEFALMETDADYQAEAVQIEREFASANWEAFQLSERARRG
jgi:metal-responsive CopG/Arc/MetJ family transcriptional regulator